MCLTRDAQVWLYNVYAPMFIIASLTFCSFAVENVHNQDRMAVNAALLLSLVALKFSVAERLPDVPYMTMLDMYTFTSIATIAASIIVITISELVRIHDPERQDQAETACLVVLGVNWLAFNVVYWTNSMMTIDSNHPRDGRAPQCMYL